MSTLPATGVLGDLDPSHTNADLAGELEDVRDFVSNRPGGGPRTELTISSGAVVPGVRDHGGCFTIDTEGDGSADDLDVITYTNMPEGSLITVYGENASRVVTLKHGNGGSGEMLMTDSADFVLDAVDKWVSFERRSSSWVEIQRFEGFATLKGQLRTMQEFPASGTWNCPNGCRAFVLEGVGGGGGGGGIDGQGAGTGGCGGGGGSGAHGFTGLISTSGITSATVTIGAAGTGGSAGSNSGAAGGSTIWADGTNTFTWGGGEAGTGLTAGATTLIREGARGGVGTNVYAGGERGSPLVRIAFDTASAGGGGAMGQGGYQASSGNGGNATGKGAGGGGGVNNDETATNYAGGDGTIGYMRVWEYY